MKTPIKIKKIKENAKMPYRGSTAAAGYDVFACINEPVKIFPHQTAMINTGLSVAVPDGYWVGVFARSGIAAKQGLRPANCTGVIDADYRGPVMVALHNDSEEIRFVEPDERIAQLIILPFMDWDIEEVDELDDTERNEGGFGSTDKKRGRI